jgi:hypothetical protein
VVVYGSDKWLELTRCVIDSIGACMSQLRVNKVHA